MLKFTKIASFSLGALLLLQPAVEAAQTTIAFDSGGTSLLYANVAKTIPLTAGSLTTNGDGAVIQLGYYTAATVANPFAGAFIPLSGAGSPNTAAPIGNTSVGDDFNQGTGNGNFAFTLTFVAGSATTGNNLPSAGQILAVRFYNTTSLATATLYNAASNAAWTFLPPQDGALAPSVSYSFGQANTVFQGATTYATVIPVPEPSTFAFAMIGLGGGVAWVTNRRRKAARA